MNKTSDLTGSVLNRRSFIRAAFLGSAACFLPFQDIIAGEKVSFTYKNGVTKTFDTDIFWVENGKIFLTAEAMTAIDVNSQKINGAHSRAAIAAETDKNKRAAMLTENLVYYYRHLADQHKDCMQQSIGMELAVTKASGGDVEKKKKEIDERYTRSPIYGTNWKNIAKDCGCSVSDINKQVKLALNLE